MKTVFLLLCLIICTNAYAQRQIAIPNQKLRIPERITITETSPKQIWWRYREFVESTQRELLIHTTSIEGKQAIAPLEETSNRLNPPKMFAIFSGLETRKDEGYKAASILKIRSFFHRLVEKKLNRFNTATYLIRDRKDVLILSGASLQEYKVHEKSGALLVILENDPVMTQKLLEEFTESLNDNAQEINIKDFKEQTLSLTREELWTSR